MSKEKWTTDNIPDLKGKVIIVTGGNSGLGYESVKAFAAKGADVVLASRSVEKGDIARKNIEKSHPAGNIVTMQLDLADFTSIKNFAKAFKQNYAKLDVLLNNAGIMTTPYHLTKDGLEAQNGVNHFGHFLLTGLLFDLIKSTPGARIVNVSSNAHKQGKMDFDNFLFENGKGYSPIKSYGRSKLSNLLFTLELQSRLELSGIEAIAVSAHPGVAETNLAQHLEDKWWFKLLLPIFSLMAQSQEQGALPQIRASTDPNVIGGQYYGPHRGMKGDPVVVESNAASHNKEDAKRLWEVSKKLTGFHYQF
jgi:NAD(P)-dependent dehydrogenase (short-subunit alcohol dehydrogenase family)